MITNIPTPDSLNEVALRLYFSAWSTLISIQAEFDQTFDPGIDPKSTEVIWETEWASYIEASQLELQSICTITQQSNELALKAKICSVSPFLLLVGNEARFSSTPKKLDFSDLKTLDAVDLPAAVNTVCNEPLSDEFIRTYNEVRSLRNKIAHLGHSGKRFSPKELLRILAFQYTELWRDRAWLNDRVLFAFQTRQAFLYDDRYSSPEIEVMYELPYTFSAFTKSEFKQLFGRDKSVRRFLCHACITSSNAIEARLDLNKCKTAYLDKTGSSLHCIMCGEDFKVARIRCDNTGCKSNVVGANADAHAGKCHVCGE
ncbi:MAG: hypothetical protein ACLP8A_18235 [Methylovirgula sp.]